MSYSPATLYDRVQIFLDGLPYLPNGYVHSFSMTAVYHDSIQHGFSTNGKATGSSVGNSEIPTITWQEYLPSLGEYINLSTFILANPNAVILIVPISLRTGAQSAPQFTLTGVVRESIVVSAAQEGTSMTRSVSLKAADSSNL